VKKIPPIVPALMLSAAAFAQSNSKVSTTVPVLTFPQGHVMESISGSGFSTISCNHVSDINGMNPASLRDLNRLSFGVSYQFDSPIDPAWIAGIRHKRKKDALPQSFGLVIPSGRLRIGAGFSQRYSSIRDYGSMLLTTVEHPDGTGEKFTSSRTSRVTGYSGIAAYSLKNAVQPEDELTFGIRGTLNRLSIEDRLYHLIGKAESNRFSWAVGFNCRFSTKAQVGLYYEKGPSFMGKIKFEYNNPLVQSDIDTSIAGNNQNINADPATRSFPMEGGLPDRLHLGISDRLNSSLRIALDLTKVYWSRALGEFSDRLDISGDLIADIFRPLSLSAGFLSTGFGYKDESDGFFGSNDNFNAFFVLGGFNLHCRRFDVDFAYAATTGSSGAWRKQRIGKLGVGFYFP
jgi:hypothetical protein